MISKHELPPNQLEAIERIERDGMVPHSSLTKREVPAFEALNDKGIIEAVLSNAQRGWCYQMREKVK